MALEPLLQEWAVAGAQGSLQSRPSSAIDPERSLQPSVLLLQGDMLTPAPE